MLTEFDKITIIGDIHGRIIWEKIVEKENDSDFFIFLGDYFDSYDNLTPGAEVNNFKKILKFKDENPHKVILLLGNHDLHYIIDEHWSRYSIYTQELLNNLHLKELLNNHTLQACKHFKSKNLWFVHAGISNTWLRNHRLFFDEKEINDLLVNSPKCFGFLGGYYSDPYGDDVFQSPTWIRPTSLHEDLPHGSVQFVGHTQIKNSEFDGLHDINFCDSLEWGRYYVYEQNPITLGFEYKLKEI